jgi:prepilin-type N-terminal cleavage/methylation domain-containing protein
MAGRLRRSTAGFTLIELLVVIMIILTLVALLGAGLGRARMSAKDKATRALIGKIKIALQNYHSEFRDFPPDGFDLEAPGTNNDGAPVGAPISGNQRRMKNTAILMYYLCRPVIKVTYMGDPSENDDRNRVRTPVGPFLELQPSNYSRGRGDSGGGDMGVFEPNFVWAGTRGGSFWDSPNNYRLTEIIDAYGRPLNYDKVKTAGPKYFQPDRFHSQNLSASGTGGKGILVHPDQEYLSGSMYVLDDRICEETDHGPSGTDETSFYRWHPDPRVKPSKLASDGCFGVISSPDTSTHEPKSVGNYDLWSMGPSYTNSRDDITSWGE